MKLTRAVQSIVVVAVGIGAASCLHVKSDPIQVNIKHEVTIGVDKALEDFFAFQEKSAATTSTTSTTTATTLPTTQPATGSRAAGGHPTAAVEGASK